MLHLLLLLLPHLDVGRVLSNPGHFWHGDHFLLLFLGPVDLYNIKVNHLKVPASKPTNSNVVDPSANDSANMSGEDGDDPPVIVETEYLQTPSRDGWGDMGD